MTLSYQGWHIFHLFEETKNQLDVLTNDIKGNANVVRTKLKCEWNRPSCVFLHTSESRCCLLLCDISTLFPKPWSKACPKMMLLTEALLTSESRKHRSGNTQPSCCTSHSDIIIIIRPLGEQNGNNVFFSGAVSRFLINNSQFTKSHLFFYQTNLEK